MGKAIKAQTDYRKQAKADLVRWWKDTIDPILEDGRRNMLAAGFTEEEAEVVLENILRNATVGLHGFGRAPE